MLCVLRAGWQPYCTLWLFVLQKCDVQPAGWCAFTVSVMRCMFQSCSTLSIYGSVWLYSGCICSVIKFVIVSLCLINEHWCHWGVRNNSHCIWKMHVLAYIFLLSLVHRQARKRFARICLTFKASVSRCPKNLGTRRVTWTKFPPEDPQSCSDLWTLTLSGALCMFTVTHIV
jgi:hypothetical protein